MKYEDCGYGGGEETFIVNMNVWEGKSIIKKTFFTGGKKNELSEIKTYSCGERKSIIYPSLF